MRLSIIVALLAAVPVDDHPLVRAMRDEMRRSMERLQLPGAEKPYFVSYRVVETDDHILSGSFGALVKDDRSRWRNLGVEVRVGTPALDNSNFLIRSWYRSSWQSSRTIPMEDDYAALRHELWLATDQAYKEAVQNLERKRAAREKKVPSKLEAGDFTQERASHTATADVGSFLELPDAAGLVRRLSALFRDFPDIQSDLVVLSFLTRRIWIVTSEGTLSYEPRTYTSLVVTCRTQAEDGMELSHFASFAAPSPEGLPPEEKLAEQVRRLARDLVQARTAPVAEDYSGPVLFEGPAAAQLLREILAENLSGTPPPEYEDPREGFMQGKDTELADKVGRRILPVGFHVEANPSVKNFRGTALIGAYRTDMEGVPAQRVALVEDGKLRKFLMSRTPRRGFDRSNGHGRMDMDGRIRARPGTLLARSSRAMPDRELRQRLLKEVRAQGLDYGIVVRLLDEPAITGGDSSDAFPYGPSGETPSLSKPRVAIKVTVDGKEEVLRGAGFGPFPLRALKEIIAVGKDGFPYNYFATGTRGGIRIFSSAHTGGYASIGLPSSLVAPALLFKEVEMKKPVGLQPRPPLLTHPYFEQKP